MVSIGRYTNKSCFRGRRKHLRNNQTVAEKRLWKRIRAEQLGVKFRRQYSIGGCIVDFYCHRYKFIIEVDGNVHGEIFQKVHDAKRQQYLVSQGYFVARFTNEQVLFDIDSVVQFIVNQLNVFRAEDPT